MTTSNCDFGSPEPKVHVILNFSGHVRRLWSQSVCLSVWLSFIFLFVFFSFQYVDFFFKNQYNFAHYDKSTFGKRNFFQANDHVYLQQRKNSLMIFKIVFFRNTWLVSTKYNITKAFRYVISFSNEVPCMYKREMMIKKGTIRDRWIWLKQVAGLTIFCANLFVAEKCCSSA